MEAMNETELREAAAKRVDARIGFLIHAVIYVAVNAGMAISGLLSGQITQSFLWCAGAWTVALVIQGIAVFGDGAHLRSRAIEAELGRLRASAPR